MAEEPATNSSEPTQPLLLWITPAVLVVFIPGLWWATADSPLPLRPNLVLIMTSFVALTTTAVFAVLSNGFRRRIRWSLGLTAAIVAIGFQWPAFTAVGAEVADATGLRLLGDVLPVIVAGTLIWLATRLAADWYFAVGATAMAVAAIVVLGLAAFSLRSADSADPAADTTAGPDVLLLVLDGYGRADWLEATFGFDNSEFVDSLEQREFQVLAEATANYAMTYGAVSTMLNLDYVFDAGALSETEWKRMRSALTGRTGMLPLFDAAGYEIVYLENAWGGSQCGPAVDRCVREGLVERTIWGLSQMTIFAPIVKQLRPDRFNSVSHRQLESLSDIVASPSTDGRPRLTVAHIILPHEPMLLDSACNRKSLDDLRSWGADPAKLEARRTNYAEQTRCVNRLVLQAVDRQLERDAESIVMITGDHGPASTLDPNQPFEEVAKETILERMTILSAYRLPGCDRNLPADLTPVNGARSATDCALGTNLGSVPDHNLWASISMVEPMVSVEPILDDAYQP